MDSFNVTDLKPGSFFTSELLLDKTFLLLSASTPVTQDLIRALNEWEFTAVYSDGQVTDRPPNAGSDSDPSAEKEIGENEASGELDDNLSEEEKLKAIEKSYQKYFEYIGKFYTQYATTKTFNKNVIIEIAKSLIDFVKKNKKHVLLVQSQISRNANPIKNYLVGHSMRTTVFAIIIALQMNVKENNLIELTVASMLHEIGMIRIPPQFYLTDRKLTVAEKKEINAHPVISFNILREAKFTPSITFGVLEHHERINGRGYPRHIVGNDISLYGKILGLACAFEAITGPRLYKDEKSTFVAMLEILKNQDMQFDSAVVNSLLLSVSFYPIGSYVCLSNNKIAQVVEANPKNPKCPIVWLVTEKDENGNNVVLQTGEITIARVLSKKETDDLLLSLQKQNGTAGN